MMQIHIFKSFLRRMDFSSSRIMKAAAIFCILNLLGLPDKIECATLRLGDFHAYPQTNVEMLNLSVEFFSVSTLACAGTCVGMHRQCFSYVYDESTKQCTPGAYVHLHPSLPLPPPIPGDMFTDSVIDVDLDNFQVYFQDGLIIYLHISADQRDYAKATERCMELGGHLLTTREAAKYKLLVSLVDGVHEGVWIGLNDLDKEGEFRWVDDKSLLTPEIGALIWGNNQPDNYNNDQHCCFWWDHYKDVADFHCDMSYNYACEYPVPYRY